MLSALGGGHGIGIGRTAGGSKRFYSLSFDGADCASHTSAGDDWVIGAEQSFTIEAWIWLATGAAGSFPSIIGIATNGGNYVWFFYNVASGQLGCQINFPTGGGANIYSSGLSLSRDTWHHAAAILDRSGPVGRIVVNGSQVGGDTDLSGKSGALGGSSKSAYIGTYAGSGDYWTGRISQLRVWIGAARTTPDIAACRHIPWLGGPTYAYGFQPGVGGSLLSYNGGPTFTLAAAPSTPTWIGSYSRLEETGPS